MPKHRFIGDFDLDQSQILVEDKEIIHQIKKVLRLKKGDEILLNDGKVREAVAEITETGLNQIEFKINQVYLNYREPEIKTVLYLALLKKDNFEISIQKATEVGIKTVIPVIGERTVKTRLNRNRLQKIIKEAAEQSGRGILPELEETKEFDQAISHAKNNQINLFLTPQTKSVFDIDIPEKIEKNSFAGIFVGPEGGWSDNEIEKAKQNDFYLTGLGDLTLRAETAAIIGSYLTVHLQRYLCK